MADKVVVPGATGYTVWNDEKESRFLASLRDGNSVSTACKAAGFARQTPYNRRKIDEAFGKRWDEAVEAGTDGLEDVAIKRAKDGSDTLLIFMLKARRREVYADLVRNWHSGPSDKPIETNTKVDDQRQPIDTFVSEFQPALAAAKVAEKH